MANETLNKFQKRLEKTLQLRNMGKSVANSSDLIDPSFFVNDSLSAMLEAKDLRIENLEKELELVESELGTAKLNYLSMASGNPMIGNRQQVSSVCQDTTWARMFCQSNRIYKDLLYLRTVT